MKMNWGCGSIQPEGWVNVDNAVNELGIWVDWTERPPCNGTHWIDARPREFHSPEACGGGPGGFPWVWADAFDFIVANHSLQQLDHHELKATLPEFLRVLRPGGCFRISVPNVLAGFDALDDGLADWFPQGDDMPELDDRFCTWATWYGTARSIFTPTYLRGLLNGAGFEDVTFQERGSTAFSDPAITELDCRCEESFIMEAFKP